MLHNNSKKTQIFISLLCHKGYVILHMGYFGIAFFKNSILCYLFFAGYLARNFQNPS